MPKRNDAADLGAAIDAGEKADRALDLRQQVVEHRPHRLEHGLGIFGLRGVLFQVLGLGERELQLLGERLGEMVAAERHAALPDAIAVGDHQVGRVGAQREHDDRLGRIVGVILIGRRQVLHLVEDDEVVDRQRRELHDIDFDARVFEGLQRPIDLVALHREQADFGLQREAVLFAAAGHLLIVPHHVFQREGNLLARFVLDDVGDLLRFDRRQA